MKDSGMRSSTSLSSSTSGSMANPNGLNSPTGSGANGGGNKKGFGKAMKSGATLFKGKGPASMARQEDDVRGRMANASETFRKAALESQTLRQEYFQFQLPKVLRVSPAQVLLTEQTLMMQALKDCADELDLGTQYHLTRFAFLTESTTVSEGSLLSPVSSEDGQYSALWYMTVLTVLGGPGLKAIFEAIDNRTDFKNYMQNYAVARGAPKGPRRDGQYEDGYVRRHPLCVKTTLTAAAGATCPDTAIHDQPGPLTSALGPGSVVDALAHAASIDGLAQRPAVAIPGSANSTAGSVRRAGHPSVDRSDIRRRSWRTAHARCGRDSKGGGEVRQGNRRVWLVLAAAQRIFD